MVRAAECVVESLVILVGCLMGCAELLGVVVCNLLLLFAMRIDVELRVVHHRVLWVGHGLTYLYVNSDRFACMLLAQVVQILRGISLPLSVEWRKP